jgi:hypothetical protein
VDTGLGQRDVAGFAAIGAIVEAVDAQVHIVQTLADAAIFLARAKGFCLVALNANNRPTRHECLHKNST